MYGRDSFLKLLPSELAHLWLLPTGSALLWYSGEMQSLLFQVVQLVKSRASSPEFMTLRVAFPTSRGGVGLGEGITSVPVPPHGRQMVVSALSHSCSWGWLTHTLAPAPAPLCCQGEAQGLFSQVLVLVRDGASSPAASGEGQN